MPICKHHMNTRNHLNKNEPEEAVKLKHRKYFEETAYSEINEYFYNNITTIVISNFTAAALLFWQLSGVIKKMPLNIWFGSVIIVLIFRIALSVWFRKAKVERKLEAYQYNLFILGSSLSAALWGIIGSLLMPMDIFYQVFIILMVSGIGGGTAISLGASYLASELYVILFLVPIIIWVGIQILNGTQVYWGILIAMILYLFYASRAVRRNSNLILNNIKLNKQNLILLENLKARSRQIELFSDMEGSLGRCHDDVEIGYICKTHLPQIFPEFSGSIFLLSESNAKLKTLETWGDFSSKLSNLDFHKDECLAFKTKSLYISYGAERCKHCYETSVFYICVPLQTSLGFYGVLHFKLTSDMITKKEEFISTEQSLITRIGADISFALNSIRYQECIKMETIQDQLTGLYNRRYLDDYFKMDKVKPIPIAVIMIDVDYFKKFNDQFGHTIGDDILHKIGVLLKRNVRADDFACRYGGEEFIMVLPGSDLKIACERAEKIREDAKLLSVSKDDKIISGITISAGISIFPEQGSTQTAIIEAADKALYKAKNEGRDRVYISNN